MKTIFITAFTNFVVRNILSTDFLRILKGQQDIRLVILAPIESRGYLEDHFGAPNVVIEGVPVLGPSKLKTLIGYFSRALLNTYTAKLFLRLRLTKSGYFFNRLLGLTLGRLRVMRTLLRLLDYKLLTKKRFAKYFNHYQPALIFSTDITDRSAGESDIDLIREAKQRGVFVVGMVRSWDNLTTRGIIREASDIIVVHNETIKEECFEYHGIPKTRISVVGIPHYDNYGRVKPTPREKFFHSLGLDPKKKTVLFVAIADMFLKKQLKSSKPTFNKYMLEVLRELDPARFQILVRFPLIGNAVDLKDFTPPANMIFDYPGKLFDKGELGPASDGHLIDSLYHSDVVVPGPSTIALDAMFFGKPVIIIAFDKEKNLPRDVSMKKFLPIEHLRPLTDLGGARITWDAKDFLRQLKDYFDNPDLDEDGRRRVVNAMCYKTDGNASKRLAQIVLANI